MSYDLINWCIVNPKSNYSASSSLTLSPLGGKSTAKQQLSLIVSELWRICDLFGLPVVSHLKFTTRAMRSHFSATDKLSSIIETSTSSFRISDLEFQYSPAMTQHFSEQLPSWRFPGGDVSEYVITVFLLHYASRYRGERPIKNLLAFSHAPRCSTPKCIYLWKKFLLKKKKYLWNS